MKKSVPKKYNYNNILIQKIISVLNINTHHFMDSSEITKAMGYERIVKTCRTYKYTIGKRIPADDEFEIINTNVKGILENLHKNGEIELKIMKYRSKELKFYKKIRYLT